MVRQPVIGSTYDLHLAPGLPPVEVVVLATGIIRGSKDDLFDVPLADGSVQGAHSVRGVVDRPTSTVLVREVATNRVRVVDTLTLRAQQPATAAA